MQTTEEIRERIEKSGVNGQVEMIQGPPAEVILEYANQNGSDLIVIGAAVLAVSASSYWARQP